MLKIAILGVGTVGRAVIDILHSNKQIITARAGCEIVPVIGLVRNANNRNDIPIRITSSLDEVLQEDFDIAVELMGGIDMPYKAVTQILKSQRAVVTANKALLAYHRYELQDIAQDTPFEFEASVAGGIPIINALRDGMSANHILSIRGILNGTCNYILTKMIQEGFSYQDALNEAQNLGYAEADPVFDVGGFDAAHKLLVLASIAYGVDAKPEDILIEGIEHIGQDEIQFAKEFDYSLKLLGIAQKRNKENKIDLRVHPVFLKKNTMIANVEGVMNAISVTGDKVGELLFYGMGAGGNATASAVVANIIDIARRGKGSPMLGFINPLEQGLYLSEPKDIELKYYIRLYVRDKSGVLSAISSILATHGISIEFVLQKPNVPDATAKILVATHQAKESDMKAALSKISDCDFIVAKPIFIRIDD